MGLEKKQAAEKHHFDSFRDHYSLPPGRIEYGDKPDVVIHGDRKIGIEIARIYKVDGRDPRSEQLQRGDRQKVIERAERNFLSLGGRKIELNIGFDHNYPIARNRINQIASDLTKFALEISPEQDSCVRNFPLEETPEIGFLYHSGIEYPNSRWCVQQSYDVPTLSVDRVKALVEEKNEKISGYIECDAHWLLLIVDFWDPAQDQDISWPAGESVGRTCFERILIYKTMFTKVVEVSQS
jgi:hypothetical protein